MSGRVWRRLLGPTVATALMAPSGPAHAHEFAPHVVRIEQTAPGRYFVAARWAPGRRAPALAVSEGCRLALPTLVCSTPTATLTFDGLPPGDSGLVVRISDMQGETQAYFVTAEPPSDSLGQRAEPGVVRVPRPRRSPHRGGLRSSSFSALARRTAAPAVEAVRRRVFVHRGAQPHSRRLGFVGHPRRRAGRGRHCADRRVSRLGSRRGGPAAIRAICRVLTLLFGLIHGLGFAGVIIEGDRPAPDTLLSLLAFNVGVEIGQLIFVGGAAALWAVVARPWRKVVVGYATGIVATTWLIARVAALGAGG